MADTLYSYKDGLFSDPIWRDQDGRTTNQNGEPLKCNSGNLCKNVVISNNVRSYMSIYLDSIELKENGSLSPTKTNLNVRVKNLENKGFIGTFSNIEVSERFINDSPDYSPSIDGRIFIKTDTIDYVYDVSDTTQPIYLKGNAEARRVISRFKANHVYAIYRNFHEDTKLDIRGVKIISLSDYSQRDWLFSYDTALKGAQNKYITINSSSPSHNLSINTDGGHVTIEGKGVVRLNGRTESVTLEKGPKAYVYREPLSLTVKEGAHLAYEYKKLYNVEPRYGHVINHGTIDGLNWRLHGKVENEGVIKGSTIFYFSSDESALLNNDTSSEFRVYCQNEQPIPLDYEVFYSKGPTGFHTLCKFKTIGEGYVLKNPFSLNGTRSSLSKKDIEISLVNNAGNLLIEAFDSDIRIKSDAVHDIEVKNTKTNSVNKIELFTPNSNVTLSGEGAFNINKVYKSGYIASYYYPIEVDNLTISNRVSNIDFESIVSGSITVSPGSMLLPTSHYGWDDRWFSATSFTNNGLLGETQYVKIKSSDDTYSIINDVGARVNAYFEEHSNNAKIVNELDISVDDAVNALPEQYKRFQELQALVGLALSKDGYNSTLEHMNNECAAGLFGKNDPQIKESLKDEKDGEGKKGRKVKRTLNRYVTLSKDNAEEVGSLVGSTMLSVIFATDESIPDPVSCASSVIAASSGTSIADWGQRNAVNLTKATKILLSDTTSSVLEPFDFAVTNLLTVMRESGDIVATEQQWTSLSNYHHEIATALHARSITYTQEQQEKLDLIIDFLNQRILQDTGLYVLHDVLNELEDSPDLFEPLPNCYHGLMNGEDPSTLSSECIAKHNEIVNTAVESIKIAMEDFIPNCRSMEPKSLAQGAIDAAQQCLLDAALSGLSDHANAEFSDRLSAIIPDEGERAHTIEKAEGYFNMIDETRTLILHNNTEYKAHVGALLDSAKEQFASFNDMIIPFRSKHTLMARKLSEFYSDFDYSVTRMPRKEDDDLRFYNFVNEFKESLSADNSPGLNDEMTIETPEGEMTYLVWGFMNEIISKYGRKGAELTFIPYESIVEFEKAKIVALQAHHKLIVTQLDFNRKAEKFIEDFNLSYTDPVLYDKLNKTANDWVDFLEQLSIMKKEFRALELPNTKYELNEFSNNTMYMNYKSSDIPIGVSNFWSWKWN
tara:strand:+ start:186 stop:3701 length:3516 start_codon:yes stop_codon:yes gene_type:complete